jgi:hypothetical protein
MSPEKQKKFAEAVQAVREFSSRLAKLSSVAGFLLRQHSAATTAPARLRIMLFAQAVATEASALVIGPGVYDGNPADKLRNLVSDKLGNQYDSKTANNTARESGYSAREVTLRSAPVSELSPAEFAEFYRVYNSARAEVSRFSELYKSEFYKLVEGSTSANKLGSWGKIPKRQRCHGLREAYSLWLQAIDLDRNECGNLVSDNNLFGRNRTVAPALFRKLARGIREEVSEVSGPAPSAKRGRELIVEFKRGPKPRADRQQRAEALLSREFCVKVYGPKPTQIALRLERPVYHRPSLRGVTIARQACKLAGSPGRALAAGKLLSRLWRTVTGREEAEEGQYGSFTRENNVEFWPTGAPEEAPQTANLIGDNNNCGASLWRIPGILRGGKPGEFVLLQVRWLNRETSAPESAYRVYHAESTASTERWLSQCSEEGSEYIRSITEPRRWGWRAPANPEEVRRNNRKITAGILRDLRRLEEITLSDSYGAGNCKPGTTAFCEALGISGLVMRGRELASRWRKYNRENRKLWSNGCGLEVSLLSRAVSYAVQRAEVSAEV